MRKGRAWASALVALALITSSAPAGAAVAPPAAAEQPAAVLPSSTDMLRVTNELRYATGAPTILEDPRLVQAAQNHAVYSVLNGTGGHYETPGNPGFTGVLAQDRARAVGYTAPFVSEVASGASDALEGVRKLWDAPYHRLGMMHPQTRVFGWGRAERSSSGVVVVGNIGKDFSTVPADVVRSPARGQTGIPSSWSGHESPSPVRPGSSGPYGYPIMIVYGGYKHVDVRGVSLHHNGTPLSVFVSPQQFERDYALVVPDKPLPVGTIDVRFDLTVAGTWLTEEWSFSTAGASTSVPAPAPVPSEPAPVPAAPTGYHSAWVTQSAVPPVAAGEIATVSLTFENTGAETWIRGTASEARLGVAGDDTFFSLLGMAVDWPLDARPAVQDAATVAPGASTTFTFQVKGVAPGSYMLRLRPVIDGVTWMEDQGVYVVVNVR
ncbi:MAG: CAP domain-containing protein [Candidatus Limnocylindria bacterium]